MRSLWHPQLYKGSLRAHQKASRVPRCLELTPHWKSFEWFNTVQSSRLSYRTISICYISFPSMELDSSEFAMTSRREASGISKK
jgi:hypothetical protein